MKTLVSGAVKRLNLERNTEPTISFERFVEDLDTGDSFTASIIEILVKEYADRCNRTNPNERRLIADNTAQSLLNLAKRRTYRPLRRSQSIRRIPADWHNPITGGSAANSGTFGRRSETRLRDLGTRLFGLDASGPLGGSGPDSDDELDAVPPVSAIDSNYGIEGARLNNNLYDAFVGGGAVAGSSAEEGGILGLMSRMERRRLSRLTRSPSPATYPVVPPQHQQEGQPAATSTTSPGGTRTLISGVHLSPVPSPSIGGATAGSSSTASSMTGPSFPQPLTASPQPIVLPATSHMPRRRMPGSRLVDFTDFTTRRRHTIREEVRDAFLGGALDSDGIRAPPRVIGRRRSRDPTVGMGGDLGSEGEGPATAMSTGGGSQMATPASAPATTADSTTATPDPTILAQWGVSSPSAIRSFFQFSRSRRHDSTGPPPPDSELWNARPTRLAPSPPPYSTIPAPVADSGASTSTGPDPIVAPAPSALLVPPEGAITSPGPSNATSSLPPPPSDVLVEGVDPSISNPGLGLGAELNDVAVAETNALFDPPWYDPPLHSPPPPSPPRLPQYAEGSQAHALETQEQSISSQSQS
ncbi:hypothetical protein AX16_003101 [Volvariella volvacea WC 439]|nr:hypothetical protein AX16_003101 [Volvariella volvacea WC 439]